MNPVDFIKEKRNYNNILKARKQQRDIEYFTLSSLQDEISIDYVRQWANRNYAGSTKFLNWVKTVFKADNWDMTRYGHMAWNSTREYEAEWN